MFHADMTFENEEIIGLPEVEERDLSASLTLRWSRKRKRWECRNAFFWQDAKNARAKYWFSHNPRRVTCCVTMRCTGFFPPSFPQGGMKL